VLRNLVGSAVDDGVIPVSHATRIKLPPIDKHHVSPLSREQVLAVISAMPERLRLAGYLGALAGLRQGEALGMTGPCVESLRRRIKVQRQLQNGQLVPMKTRGSVRAVPADDMLLEAVAEHMRQFRPGTGLLLITTVRGEPVGHTYFGSSWRAVVKDAVCRPDAVPRSPALLRQRPHPGQPEPEGRSGTARALGDRDDDECLRAPVPRR
jgi:integrase